VLNQKEVALVLAVLFVGVSGCAQQKRANLSFRYGVEALASGSPRTAIPFLCQATRWDSEAPEPRSMLAVAYALNLQPEDAIRQANQVRRNHRGDGPPRWECIAMGIAATYRHDPSRAVTYFENFRSGAEASPAVKRAATQWLALALLLKGDKKGALELLGRFPRGSELRTTALLWSVLIHGHDGDVREAADALRTIALEANGQDRPGSAQPTNLRAMGDQYLRDAGVAAVRQGQASKAEALFSALARRNTNSYDAQVWLALISASLGRWDQAGERLKNGCREGPMYSQSLSSDLSSVLCALEGRPRAMIQHQLAARRLARRSSLRMYVSQPN